MNDAKPTHGGARPGAGRPRTVRRGGPHRARPELASKHPVHVTLRTLRGVPRLRQARIYHAFLGVLARYYERADFRVVHISLQHNHVHLIVEAAGADALRRGMQSFAINAARAINKACRRTGKVFSHRYHALPIKTAKYAWNAVAYVLNNWRRHREHMPASVTLDPFSSAIAFTGWTRRFAMPRDYVPLPVSPPRTALLKHGWDVFGRIPPDERPGPPDQGPVE